MSEARHQLVIDRFEGDLAVAEIDGGDVLDLPRWFLPDGVQEDDVVVARRSAGADGAVTLELRVDTAATERARARAKEIIDRLRARDPGGDLSL